MTEKHLERKLKRHIESIGGLCLKWSSPAHRGVPDRICLLPDGRVIFAEVKAANGRLSKLQALMIQQLTALGHDTRIINSEAQIDAIR
jgi:hypothetical protein